MNSWIPKNKIVKLAIFTALFGTVLYLVGLFVVLGQIKKVENFYNNTESEFSKEKKFWAIKSMAETNKEVIQTLRNYFIQKGDEVKFIERIEEIAKDSAIKFEIASIEVTTNGTNAFKEDIGVKINLEGSWKNIMRFVDGLEKMSSGALIKSINLDASAPGSWSGFVEFVIFREK